MARALQTAAAVPALQLLGSAAHGAQHAGLIADPARALDLPPNFSYRALSRMGDVMSDGLIEPGAHDGMAAFPIDGDPLRCVLMRNHEIAADEAAGGAFGADCARAATLDRSLFYDHTPTGRALHGGVTTMIVDVRAGRVEHSFLSLAGTASNCSGGPTPWGSWQSCEETLEGPGAHATRPHGFVFEIPSASRALITPQPLTEMGRFRHESAAVDPATGAVYQTEDEGDGLFYRFTPNAPGDLARGGRLQALALSDHARGDTRNWPGGPAIERGARLPVRWIDLDDVAAPDADLRLRGHAAGAALFARGEGMACAIENGRTAIYFACTSGGAAERGQIWRYTPHDSMLALFAESIDRAHMDMADNIVVAPWGDIIFCEDGDGEQFVRGISPQGAIYPIARNALPGRSEFCGACFSPDGSTLFVNVQEPGVTYAITGPWAALARG